MTLSVELPVVQAPALAQRSPPAPWRAALGAVLLLAYFLWAGSSYDPRRAALWTYTKPVPSPKAAAEWLTHWFGWIVRMPAKDVADWLTRWSGGWMVPAPGLGHLFLAAALVFAALSVLAYRTLPYGNRAARATVGGQKHSHMWQMVTVALIVVVALDVQLIVLRTWLPLTLDSATALARAFKPPVVARGPAILADLATLGLLFAALAAQGRSLWLAAVFAFHPLVLMESAGNGAHAAWVLPLVVLAALGWRLHKWLRELVIVGAAAACTWWVAHLAFKGEAFNGLLADCLRMLSVEGRAQAWTLVIMEMVLQAAVVFLAFRQGWSLARTLGHMLVVWAIVAPRVMPADVLPLIALLPLGWNRAGWVLSGTILLTYAMLPLAGPGTPWRAPLWLILLMLLPVAVTEVQDLLMAWWQGGRENRVACAAG